MTIQRQRPGVAARGVEGETICPNPTAPGNGETGPVEPAGPVPEPLIDILRRLADALDRQAAPPRLTWRLSEIAAEYGDAIAVRFARAAVRQSQTASRA